MPSIDLTPSPLALLLLEQVLKGTQRGQQAPARRTAYGVVGVDLSDDLSGEVAHLSVVPGQLFELVAQFGMLVEKGLKPWTAAIGNMDEQLLGALLHQRISLSHVRPLSSGRSSGRARRKARPAKDRPAAPGSGSAYATSAGSSKR